jgi:hypothetical protein
MRAGSGRRSSRAAATCALGVTLLLPDLATAQHEIGHLVWELGEPLHCAQLPAGQRICTWHVDRSYHRVCEFDAAGVAAKDACFDSPDNVSMSVFPDPGQHQTIQESNAARPRPTPPDRHR